MAVRSPLDRHLATALRTLLALEGALYLWANSRLLYKWVRITLNFSKLEQNFYMIFHFLLDKFIFFCRYPWV